MKLFFIITIVLFTGIIALRAILLQNLLKWRRATNAAHNEYPLGWNRFNSILGLFFWADIATIIVGLLYYFL